MKKQRAVTCQDRNLGPAALRAYKSGAVSLDDFVGVEKSVDWGLTRYTRSLTEILGDRAAQFKKGRKRK